MKTRLNLVALLAIVGGVTLALSAPPWPKDVAPALAHEIGTPDPNGLIWEGCYEIATLDIPVSYVAADALVPEGYTVLRFDDPDTQETNEAIDPTLPRDKWKASVQVYGGKCGHVKVGGVAVPDVIDVGIQIPIMAYDDSRCGANGVECPAPPPHSSFLLVDNQNVRRELYQVEWMTNSKDEARWLRRATGLGDSVRVVPGLVFNYNPELNGQASHDVGAADEQVFLGVPSPARSPFHIGCDPSDETCSQGCQSSDPGCERARIDEPSVPLIHGENFWHTSDDETTVIIHQDHLEPFRILTATGTITSDDHSSPLGILFDDPATEEVDMQTRNFDDTGVSLFKPNTQFTKCVRSSPDASGECTPEDHEDPCAIPEPEADPACDPCADPELLDALCPVVDRLLMGTGGAPVGGLALAVAVGAAAEWRRRSITNRRKEGRGS